MFKADLHVKEETVVLNYFRTNGSIVIVMRPVLEFLLGRGVYDLFVKKIRPVLLAIYQ